MVLQTKNTITILSAFLLIVSCERKSSGLEVIPIDVETMPMIYDEKITAFLSDSGYTKLKVVTNVWESYSNKNNPHWYFPDKVYVEEYDTLFNVVGYLKADTAYYFEKEALWQLIGNVFMVNIEGTVLETSELFWEQNASAEATCAIRVDKDKFVKITQLNGDFWTGYGLCSDRAMKSPRIYSIGGEITYTEQSDSATVEQPDSVMMEDKKIDIK
ncbi:MAG: hypothetical protein LBR13_07590 [Dysgonamonadaceae bacterium]|nr:hypothetical protein [Dysgonamonadaceae bacterium]